MKIFSAEQMRAADAVTIQNNQISSLDLMEHAATQIFNLIHQRLQGAQIPIHVFCGIGKNGGDGLVISRLLVEYGYNVHTHIVNFSEKRSKEFLVNYDRLKAISKEWPSQIKCEDDFPELNKEDLVIDAIFGIGLNRPIVDWVKTLIKHINAARCFTLAVDLPSGLYTDKMPEDREAVIYASITITFQLPKLVFFLPETGIYTHELEVINIGLDSMFLQQTPGIAQLIAKHEVMPIYRPRHKYAHKGDFGHVLAIGGSYGKIGSITLTTEAALRIGAGLTTAYVPECGYDIVQTAVPEAMVITDDEDDYITEIKYDIKPSVIALGPGMGTHDKTKESLKKLLKEVETPMVIDADGINIIASDKELISSIPKGSVLTPHPKELMRLIGSWEGDFDKLEKAKAFSTTHDLILIIKGANTLTIYKDQIFVNTTGNPGMATAGSGDVLTGMIAGLVAQGYNTLEAAVFAVYLHGSAGDLAIQELGYQALLARDIIKNIGKSFIELFKVTNPNTPQQNGQQ